jgi:hypothetical protein
MKHSAQLVLGALTVLVTVAAVSSPEQKPSLVQNSPLRPAVPLEPVAAIVDAFRSHSVVAVTAGHGQERGYAFLLTLVRDPRFVAVVNDIVIEEGSARYQDVADRFIGGDDVSDESLSQIWQNTTQATPGLDRPWSEFFRAVRSLNASLPPERPLRVLLGDPPIDWTSVHSPADHRRWIEMRETFPTELIQREVLAKRRHALLTYGQLHFQRKNLGANYESEGQAETIVSRLEKLSGTTVFTIWTSTDIGKLQSDAASWPVPSIAVVRGTVLGAADFTFYYPSEAMGRFALRDGKADFSSPIPRDQWRTLRAEDQFDAVLYPGPQPSAGVPVSPARCADDAYIETLRRIAVAGLPPAESDRLKQYCASLARP